jgi:hypothetical protein
MTDVAALLTGAHVVAYPYYRGITGRDALYRLWQMVEQDGSAASIFYAQDCPYESWRGDLVEFVQAFSAPSRQTLVMTRKGPGTPFGLVWFDSLPGQRYALLGLWYQRHTTPLAREGTALATRYAFEVLGYPKVVGWTPHKTALHHGLALGWRHEATLNGLVEVQGTPTPIYVLVLEPAPSRPPILVAEGQGGHPALARATAAEAV